MNTLLDPLVYNLKSMNTFNPPSPCSTRVNILKEGWNITIIHSLESYTSNTRLSTVQKGKRNIQNRYIQGVQMGSLQTLVRREVCFWHQIYQKEFFAGAETLLKIFLGIFYVNSKLWIKSGWEGSKMTILSRFWAFSATFYSKSGDQKHIQSRWNFGIDIENTQKTF